MLSITKYGSESFSLATQRQREKSTIISIFDTALSVKYKRVHRNKIRTSVAKNDEVLTMIFLYKCTKIEQFCELKRLALYN